MKNKQKEWHPATKPLKAIMFIVECQDVNMKRYLQYRTDMLVCLQTMVCLLYDRCVCSVQPYPGVTQLAKRRPDILYKKYCAFYPYSPRSSFPGSRMVSNKMGFQFLKKRENFLSTKSLKTRLDISAKSDLTM